MKYEHENNGPGNYVLHQLEDDRFKWIPDKMLKSKTGRIEVIYCKWLS